MSINFSGVSTNALGLSGRDLGQRKTKWGYCCWLSDQILHNQQAQPGWLLRRIRAADRRKRRLGMPPPLRSTPSAPGFRFGSIRATSLNHSCITSASRLISTMRRAAKAASMPAKFASTSFSNSALAILPVEISAVAWMELCGIRERLTGCLTAVATPSVSAFYYPRPQAMRPAGRSWIPLWQSTGLRY